MKPTISSFSGLVLFLMSVGASAQPGTDHEPDSNRCAKPHPQACQVMHISYPSARQTFRSMESAGYNFTAIDKNQVSNQAIIYLVINDKIVTQAYTADLRSAHRDRQVREEAIFECRTLESRKKCSCAY